MPRAPFQVLVIPFRRSGDGCREYALFRRSDDGKWQGIAGGGEAGETPEGAARREAFEEAGIGTDARLVALDATTSIPVVHFGDGNLWPGLYVIPEHAFGIECPEGIIRLSAEHVAHEWLRYEDALARASWESNRTALWELDRRLADALPGSR